MRSSYIRIALGLVAISTVAALWIIPSHAQVPGTLERPGMTTARVWVNNKTHDEAIPVTLVGGDPKAPPVPVAVVGTATVNGKVETTRARQLWEYRLVSVGEQDVQAQLVGLGNDGWEAVGLTSQPGAKIGVLLKRPK